ncbi:MAG: MBL fold metallo-hydrolase [Clostridium sp.]
MIKVLGSSSKGNCYLLECEGERLLIECGFSYKKILEFLEYNLDILGCLVTHEHKDHCKAVVDLAKNGIDVYSSKGTFEGIGVSSHRFRVLIPNQQVKIGGFTVLPFQVEHDTNEPIGFLIHHRAIGKLLFVTDTFYLRYKFKDLNHILIECNYSEDILKKNEESGKIDKWRRARVEKSHFSLENLIEFFKSNDLSEVKTIVLLHLSEDNGNNELFKKEVQRATGKVVYVADSNSSFELRR